MNWARTYNTALSDHKVADTLNKLWKDIDFSEYRETMLDLGGILGTAVNREIPKHHRCLVVSTAEDADYLSLGVIQSLDKDHETLAAVFWNNYVRIEGGPIAPIIHKYLQPGYEDSEYLVIVKSIISTSCVVRTNILALIETVMAKKIYIVAPVMFAGAEQSLRDEFPENISSRFQFIFFATDYVRNESTGDVVPGIGGQIYQRLGLEDQPARVGYIPELVKKLAKL